MTSPGEQVREEACHPTERGAWVCLPQHCNREKGMCPERLVWELNNDGKGACDV